MNTLRRVRIILAALVFSPVFLFLCDFANLMPVHLHGLMHIQIVPAILAGSIAVLTGLFLMTILFGRIYCSVICPFGIFQDIIARFSGKGKKKNRKKRRYKYMRPLTILRYSILFICTVLLILGITFPVLLLDPYSNFGRIAVNLFRPLVMEGNNLLNWLALKFHIHHFYYVTIYTITGLSFAISITILLIVGIMALFRGRLFCNSICPAGSLLGLISRFSLFKITLDNSVCNSCCLCENVCKSQCINGKEKFIDHSRCVVCFNCLKQCKSNLIKYRFTYKNLPQRLVTEEKNISGITKRSNGIGINRRSFLISSTTIAASIPFLQAWTQSGKENHSMIPARNSRLSRLRYRFRNRFRTDYLPITPPGSISLTHFEERCTACHLCITHCPQQILMPAGFEYGINYAFKPEMVFYEMAFCSYECTVCSEICPTGAIQRLTKEEKKVTQVGIAWFRRGRCIVFTDDTSCGACSEHCPTQAVRMEPYIDGLTLPQVYPDLCIGCGGCESICPVRPYKAINVIANEIHQKAEKPPEEEILEINPEELDFGF